MNRKEYESIVAGLEKAAEEKIKLATEVKESQVREKALESKLEERDKSLQKMQQEISAVKKSFDETQKQLSTQRLILIGLGILSAFLLIRVLG